MESRAALHSPSSASCAVIPGTRGASTSSRKFRKGYPLGAPGRGAGRVRQPVPAADRPTALGSDADLQHRAQLWVVALDFGGARQDRTLVPEHDAVQVDAEDAAVVAAAQSLAAALQERQRETQRSDDGALQRDGRQYARRLRTAAPA